MDLAIFTGCLGVGLFVGLTMKKHGVFLIPQSLDIMQTNNQYYKRQEADMEKLEVENYFTFKNTTRHLGSNRV